MKVKYIFIEFLIFLILSSFFSACSNNIINKFQKEENVSIFLGDTVAIIWDFENADSVLIHGTEAIFRPKDSILVSPPTSTVYYINAYNSYGDKQMMKYRVNVTNQIQTGPALSDLINFNESTQSSNYLVGVTKSNKDVDKLKITGSLYPHNNNNNNFSLKFLPIDKFGNYIENFSSAPEDIELLSKNSTAKPSVIKLNENIDIDTSRLINFCFCIDNSAAATENNNYIYKQIYSFSKLFNPIDNYFISYFNQNFGSVKLIKKNTKDNNSFEDFDLDIPAPSGFNSLNKSLGQVINSLYEYSGQNVLILITQSADNASVLYDERDLLEYSRKSNIPIYVIVIGSEVPTYNLTYLANGTGGAIYIIENEELNELPNIINEIVFSQRYYYSIDFLSSVGTNQKELSLELILKDNLGDFITSSFYNMPLKQDKILSDFQFVAAFDKNEDIVLKEYFTGLRDLSEVLNNNPAVLVELIGHSDVSEGASEKERTEKALIRAQNLRRKLVDFGANPSQIRLRSEGSVLPLYPFPKKDWQLFYNTRVEIRWLSPSSLPFEIIFGTVKTETEALKEIDNLEYLGYQAYYERIILEKKTAYRIIIWGYATEELAKQAQKTLSKDFKKKFYIK